MRSRSYSCFLRALPSVSARGRSFADAVSRDSMVIGRGSRVRNIWVCCLTLAAGTSGLPADMAGRQSVLQARMR